MDSGRKALLEKAREFGILARTSSWDEILKRSVTFRTLALYLGIHTKWWEEFWRSFYFADEKRGLRTFRFCCKAKDLPFVMSFLSSWFGKGAKISDISEKEFARVYHLAMKDGKGQAARGES